MRLAKYVAALSLTMMATAFGQVAPPPGQGTAPLPPGAAMPATQDQSTPAQPQPTKSPAEKRDEENHAVYARDLCPDPGAPIGLLDLNDPKVAKHIKDCADAIDLDSQFLKLQGDRATNLKTLCATGYGPSDRCEKTSGDDKHVSSAQNAVTSGIGGVSPSTIGTGVPQFQGQTFVPIQQQDAIPLYIESWGPADKLVATLLYPQGPVRVTKNSPAGSGYTVAKITASEIILEKKGAKPLVLPYIRGAAPIAGR